jgi:hypothetical protein
MFGAVDLTDLGHSEPFMRTAIQVALGGSAKVRRSASPISYLGSGANAEAVAAGVRPPHLIPQGSDDEGVRPRHSQAFARRLERPECRCG